MSDLFHEDVPDEFVARVFWTMARTPTHTYQILTKRPARMRDWIRGARARRILGPAGPLPVPLPNVWIGTSIENQRELERRLEPLLETPAAIRFLSCEPLLGPLDFEERPVDPLSTMGPWSRLELGIGWVIVGGESGPGARSMAPEWARGIRDQALAAGIPFFFKQWGGPRKAAAGRELDGRVWEEFPE